MYFTGQGTVVPLADCEHSPWLEEPVLRRRNRDMAITVRADVKDGEQGVSVTQSIRPAVEEVSAKLPAGYRIDVVAQSRRATRPIVLSPPWLRSCCWPS